MYFIPDGDGVKLVEHKLSSNEIEFYTKISQLSVSEQQLCPTSVAVKRESFSPGEPTSIYLKSNTYPEGFYQQVSYVPAPADDPHTKWVFTSPGDQQRMVEFTAQIIPNSYHSIYVCFELQGGETSHQTIVETKTDTLDTIKKITALTTKESEDLRNVSDKIVNYLNTLGLKEKQVALAKLVNTPLQELIEDERFRKILINSSLITTLVKVGFSNDDLMVGLTETIITPNTQEIRISEGATLIFEPRVIGKSKHNPNSLAHFSNIPLLQARGVIVYNILTCSRGEQKQFLTIIGEKKTTTGVREITLAPATLHKDPQYHDVVAELDATIMLRPITERAVVSNSAELIANTQKQAGCLVFWDSDAPSALRLLEWTRTDRLSVTVKDNIALPSVLLDGKTPTKIRIEQTGRSPMFMLITFEDGSHKAWQIVANIQTNQSSYTAKPIELTPEMEVSSSLNLRISGTDLYAIFIDSTGKIVEQSCQPMGNRSLFLPIIVTS